MTTMGVYAIVNTLNGKKYVGSSRDVASRLSGHVRLLDRGHHHCAHLLHAWRLYGSKAFAFELLERVNGLDELVGREQFWLDTTPDVYNATPCALRGPGMTGLRHSAETKARISAKKKGCAPTKLTDEGRERIRQTMLKNRPLMNSACSEQKARNISAAKLGWNPSAITRARMSAAKLGRKLSEMTRQRMSESHLRRSGRGKA